jgi:hypothetical protein
MYSERYDFFAGLEKNMPEIFSRQEASKMIGNILSSATLNNLDSKKLGPKNLKQIGKKVCYEKHSFIDWLKSYHNFTAHIKGKSNNKTNFETVKSAKNNYASGVYNLQQVLFPDQ